MLKILHRNNLFVANDELTERKMAIIAKELGYKRIKALRGGMDNFKKEILNYQANPNPLTSIERDKNKFRLYAKAMLPNHLKKFKPSDNVKSDKPKRVLGGC